MKVIVLAAVFALAFTSGFTCSKNQPAEEAAAPTQEQMAAPTEGDMMAPEGDMGASDGEMAPPAEGN
jgi:hypothetical protein